MQAISSCVVDEITVTYREIITPSGNPTQPANPYGVFLFDTTTPEAYFIATIPGLRSELLKLPPDDIHIDVEQADVAAFINYITGSLFVNPFANIIASIDEAYIQHRIHSGRYIP